MEQIKKRIQELKKEKDMVVLAHYYVPDEVQEIADYIGDSYNLSRLATEVPQQTIIFCGVSFMGESAKTLNPDKRVLMPDLRADCTMAHMADVDKIDMVRKEYEDVAVVCYVNSTSELKAKSDVCVTSSNALKIVKALPNKRIYFIPDENLARYIASQVPEKEFIFNDGFCHVHASIKREDVVKAKALRPEAKVLAHPECRAEVLEEADYIGSTSGIIQCATESEDQDFIICTEAGVLYEIKQKNPGKRFYAPGLPRYCANMKKNTLEKVLRVMEEEDNEIHLSEELRLQANEPLARMLELAR